MKVVLQSCRRYALCLLGFLSLSLVALAQGQLQDMRVLEEVRKTDGTIVRKIQYTQNGKRVTETHVIKPHEVVNVPINPDTLDKSQLMVVIHKSRFSLDVYYKRKKIRSYKVVFGPKPKEDKKMKGDRCTPEGKFLVLNKRPSARYNKFIQIDYPNDSSYIHFNNLKKRGLIPANAEIGGDVGIHGIWKGGDDMIEMGMGWTDGCIAMKNADVDDLYRFLEAGVPVYIRKQ